MNGCAQGLFLLFCITLLSGCSESYVDLPAVRSAKAKVEQIGTEAGKGVATFGSRKEIAEIVNLIGEVSDLEQRRRLVDDYGQMLLSIDLVQSSFRGRENAALGYFAHLDNAVRMMRTCGCPQRQSLNLFFAGLSKFEDACLCVPTGPRRQGETLQDFAWRGDCVRKLREEYFQRMSEIRRFWLPHLGERFAAEVHDEFRRRIEPFLRSPEDGEREKFSALPSGRVSWKAKGG